MKVLYIIVHSKERKPVQAVSTECVVFSTRKAAQEQINEWKAQGKSVSSKTRIYGHDTFNVNTLKIAPIPYVA